MGNDFYRKLGAVFLIAAAAIHTIERVAAKLATGLYVSGWVSSGNQSGDIPRVPVLENATFIDNWFVPAFVLIGIILFVAGFPRK